MTFPKVRNPGDRAEKKKRHHQNDDAELDIVATKDAGEVITH